MARSPLPEIGQDEGLGGKEVRWSLGKKEGRENHMTPWWGRGGLEVLAFHKGGREEEEEVCGFQGSVLLPTRKTQPPVPSIPILDTG